MQAAMDRLGSFISRRRKFVLGIWIALLVVSLPFFAMQGKNLTAGGFEVPGSQSTFVADSIKKFPGVEAEKLVFVFDNTKGDKAKTDAAITKAVSATKGVEGVQVVPEFEQAARASSDPIVLMALQVTGSADPTADAAAEIRKNADILEGDDAVSPIHLVGLQALWAGMQDLSKEDLEKAEGIGFPIVFIVLLLIFGSVAAALLPLSLGFIAVAITGAIVYFLAQAIQMSIFVTNISSMLGIGVAVDYSLFVLSRYREEIKRRRASEDDARQVAMRTSGLAVAFSGVTVIVALAGLFLINSKTAHSMAIGAIVVVAVAVLAAVTLLPALIATLGHRVYEPGKVVGKVVAKLSRKPKPDAVPFWTRWTNRLMNRPVLYATVGHRADALDRVPGVVDEARHGRHRPAPERLRDRQGHPARRQAAGPGAGGPISIVADYGNGTATPTRCSSSARP